MGRFDYIKYDDVAMDEQVKAKGLFVALGLFIETMPKGRAQSLAITKLEESYMWVGKAIRDAQLERNGKAELQEQRKDG